MLIIQRQHDRDAIAAHVDQKDVGSLRLGFLCRVQIGCRGDVDKHLDMDDLEPEPIAGSCANVSNAVRKLSQDKCLVGSVEHNQ